jgi:succinoglycan biosynthesis protein ExoV
MRLCYWKRTGEIPNFGDALNPFIFGHLLPGVLDENPHAILVGIGTLLEKGMGEVLNIPAEYVENDEPLSRWIVVFGSGAGYFDPPTIDARWRIYCVRGPLTAKLLGLDEDAAVADPAILVRRVFRGTAGKSRKISLMPHHATSGAVLKAICGEADIHYIDPLDSVENILDAISATEVLLTEALHGAIVADALRTPWVPIKTNEEVFAFKWEDWCRSIEREYVPIAVSSVLGRIWAETGKKSLLEAAKRKVKFKLVERDLRRIAANARPLLSSDAVIEKRTAELERRLELFRQDWINSRFS